ncbi:MAG: hypothetical protein EOO40_00170 [Deltaproteobacteria bacterium]|nr:MAG: hypothetical protein EOO40_00170 [Deltaproteobacteria bacterium]
MTDRCRPLKIESVAEGGSQNDATGGVCEVDIGQDYLDAAGVTLQAPNANTLTADAKVRVERTPQGAMHFVDTLANGTQGLDLSQLVTSVSGSVGAFNALCDIRLWLDGPGDGFVSGAVKVRLGTAPNPAGYVWYASGAQTLRLFDCAIAYPANSVYPQSKTYRLYGPDGVTVVRTVVDTLTYSGPLLVRTQRSWS